MSSSELNPARYLGLREGCALVRGARRSAIYDLREGEIYRLDERMTRVMDRVERGMPIPEPIPFLDRLPVLEWRSSPWRGTGAQPTLHPSGTLDFLWIELTGICNLRCLHCYARAGEAPLADEIGTDRWLEILEEAADLGCRNVQFTGGEPGIHPDLLGLIRRARRAGFEFIEVFTNGTLLSEAILDGLAEAGVHVAMSVYSHDPDIHDAITGVPGSHASTLRTMRSLLRRGVPVRVAVIVLRLNEDGLEETVRSIRALGVESVKVDTVRPTGRGRDPSLQPVRWASQMTSPRFGPPGGRTCWSGKLAVDSRGSVYPCIFDREDALGDLSRQSLGEVISSSAVHRLWSLHLGEVEICRDCEFRFACRDCRAIARTSRGSIASRTPRCTYDPYAGEWGEGTGRQVEEAEMTGKEGDALQRPHRREGVVTRDVDEEVVIYNPETRGIHGLNPTAAFVWDLCDGSRTVAEIAQELQAIYPDAPDVCKDVEQTLRELLSLGLIEDRG
jgi:radical SAM protein with 4Fe4S-binding SPASM domain